MHVKIVFHAKQTALHTHRDGEWFSLVWLLSIKVEVQLEMQTKQTWMFKCGKCNRARSATVGRWFERRNRNRNKQDWRNTTKMHKCTNAQMLKCSNAQMHQCTNAQCSNAQMHKCTNAQMHKCSKSTNAQMLKCSNAQMLKYSNAQILKLPRTNAAQMQFNCSSRFQP